MGLLVKSVIKIIKMIIFLMKKIPILPLIGLRHVDAISLLDLFYLMT